MSGGGSGVQVKRERERDIGEGRGGIEGANRRRQEYARVFLHMFDTVASRGMPCRLWMLMWRVWDLA